MPYRVTINGYDVSMDTADELRAVVGTSQRSLPPMSTTTATVAPAASAPAPSNGNGAAKPRRASAGGTKGGDLGLKLEALRPWWNHLSPRYLEYVEARVRGETTEEIGKRVGVVTATVSVSLNIARRKLEGCRDAVSIAEVVAKESSNDDEPEPEPDSDPEPEPDDDDDDYDETEPDVERAAPDVVVFGGGGDSLQGYLKAVRSYPMISREEELSLATKFAATRDPAIAKKLVQANLRYVVKLALSFHSEKTKLLDLIQEGNLGLMHAVQRFEPGRGCKLVTYAAHWIKACIKQFVMHDKRLIKVGTTNAQRKLFWALEKTRKKLEMESGVEPTSEEIAKELGVRASDVDEMVARKVSEVSIDKHPQSDGEESPSDWLADGVPLQDELFERRQAAEGLRRQAEALRFSLSPRMRRILDRRVLAEEPTTLQDMADEFGVSRERVRQLEEKIFDRLRERLEDAA